LNATTTTGLVAVQALADVVVQVEEHDRSVVAGGSDEAPSGLNVTSLTFAGYRSEECLVSRLVSQSSTVPSVPRSSIVASVGLNVTARRRSC
jgi:hypothetical protein